MSRRRSAALTLLVLTIGILGFLLAPAPGAWADDLDDLCKEVPAPVRPDYNIAGWVMDKPDLAKVPEVAPDPFADPRVPISDVYGFGWRWTNYDLGCGNDFIRDPNAVVNTNVGNFELAGSAFVAASMESLENTARAFDLDWLVDVAVRAADTIRPMVLGIGLPLGVVMVGLLVALAAKRASYDETMRRLLIVFGCVGAALFTLVYPATAATKADELAQSVADVSQAGFSTKTSDLIVRSSVYPTWLMGNFGSADSPVAKEYGPRLLSATTYSWSDVKRMEADPRTKETIDRAKAAEFREIATEVEKKDPAAYASFTGRVDTRTSAALLGGIWVAIMGFFSTVAGLIMVLGRLIMVGLVIVTPLAVIVGVVNFSVLQRLWDLFAAAVVNIAKFTIAAGLMTLVLGALQVAPVSVGQKLLITIVVTVIAVMLTRPLQSFKSMAGLDTRRSVFRGLLKRGTSAMLGFSVGRQAGEDNDAGPGGQVSAARSVAHHREPSFGPLPQPNPAVQGFGATTFAEQVPPLAHRELAPGPRPTSWAGASAFAMGHRSRAALSETPSSAAAASPGFAPDTGAPRRSAADERHLSDVVYPTGVLIRRAPAPPRESGLYRTGPAMEDYFRLPEAPLDPDGREASSVTYRSGRSAREHAAAI